MLMRMISSLSIFLICLSASSSTITLEEEPYDDMLYKHIDPFGEKEPLPKSGRRYALFQERLLCALKRDDIEDTIYLFLRIRDISATLMEQITYTSLLGFGVGLEFAPLTMGASVVASIALCSPVIHEQRKKYKRYKKLKNRARALIMKHMTPARLKNIIRLTQNKGDKQMMEIIRAELHRLPAAKTSATAGSVP